MRNFNETEEQKRLMNMPAASFEKFMRERFPRFFVQLDLPPSESCMAFGFEIGRGWYPLLFELCEKIEAVVLP